MNVIMLPDISIYVTRSEGVLMYQSFHVRGASEELALLRLGNADEIALKAPVMLDRLICMGVGEPSRLRPG